MKLGIAPGTEQFSLTIPAHEVRLAADVFVPPRAQGLVVFAHGSGSSRYSPRNRLVAGEINEVGVATMLVDLLTDEEESMDERAAALRFDIPMLSDRLVGITDWVLHQPRFAALRLGYFGASTGAAAALRAAADRAGIVKAVVSRGGRPDLAGREVLARVAAPTLFIVGSEDHAVLQLNRNAMAQLPKTTTSSLEIVRGATHLFGEPGALQKVAELARSWFQQNLNYKN